jgi:hypothetical protein
MKNMTNELKKQIEQLWLDYPNPKDLGIFLIQNKIVDTACDAKKTCRFYLDWMTESRMSSFYSTAQVLLHTHRLEQAGIDVSSKPNQLTKNL